MLRIYQDCLVMVSEVRVYVDRIRQFDRNVADQMSPPVRMETSFAGFTERP